MTAWGEPRRPAERGADPNLCQNDGVSPLIKAAMAPGDAGLGAAALLLDAKADVDHQHGGGSTALHFAGQTSVQSTTAQVCIQTTCVNSVA